MGKVSFSCCLPLMIAGIFCLSARAEETSTPSRSDVDYEKLAASIRPSEIRKDIEYLAGLGSRVLGYPGADRAIDYVQRRLEGLGYEVKRETFPEVSLVDHGGRLEAPELEEAIPVHALWANMARPPSTPEEGLRGNLIYAGDGEYRNYDGQEVDGNIVLLDFNTTNHYLRAFMLGAKAVIFLEPDGPERKEAEAKLLNISVYAPKYYVEKAYSPKLLSLARNHVRATVHCRVTWQRVTGTNLLVQIPGQKEELAEDGAVLTAHCDAMSIVPSLCPGADQASSMALWLQMARLLKNHPPQRPVTLLATNAHCINNAGAKNFLRMHPRKEEELKIKFYRNILKDSQRWEQFKVQKKERIEHFEELHPEEPEPTIEAAPLWPAPNAEYSEADFLNRRFAISLDLSSRTDTLAAFVNGVRGLAEINQQRVMLPLNEVLRQQADAAFGEESTLYFGSGISETQGITWDSMLPMDLALDCRPFLDLMREALAIVTTFDMRLSTDTPQDRLEYVDFANLEVQAVTLAKVLGGFLLDHRPVSVNKISMVEFLDWARSRALYLDPKKMTYTGMAETPVPNTLMLLEDFDAQRAEPGQDAKAECPLGHTGVRAWGYLLTNQDGWATMIIDGPDPQMRKEAYLIEPDGSLSMSIDTGVFGVGRLGNLSGTSASTGAAMFPFKILDFFETLDIRDMRYAGGIHLLDQNDGFPMRWGGASNGRTGFLTLDSILRLKLIAGGNGNFSLLLLNTDEENPTGTGYGPDDRNRIPQTFFKAVRDQVRLVEFRRHRMAVCGIRYKFTDRMAKEAQASLEKAQAEVRQRRYSEAVHDFFDASSRAGTAYPLIWNVMTDTIYALVLVFILVVPFSIFFERLIFSIVILQRRILVIFTVFVAICIVLSLVHPGFEIATSPYLIPLAFVILSLVLIVLLMMIGRFDKQMEDLHALSDQVHRQDVNRVGALWMAVSIGIGNLRRRKARTTLTILTLILITFSLLSLTSGEISRKHFQFDVENRPNYPGVLVRGRQWERLSEVAPEVLNITFGQQATLAPRCWIYRGHEVTLTIPLSSNGHRGTAYGLSGFTPQEAEVSGISSIIPGQRWFTPDGGPQCMLPTGIADQLELNESHIGEAKVRIYGRDFTLAAIFQPGRVEEYLDLDGEPFSPLLPIRKPPTADPDALLQYIHLDLNDTVFVTYRDLRNMGAGIVSVAMRFHNLETYPQLINDFASRSNILAYIALGDRVEAWSYLGVAFVSGLKDLIVPLLIGALLILNTMLNSVYERAREINIFGAVGLNPIHIAMLFVAEALVYGVLGIMFGYLLGQFVSFSMIHFGVASGLALNYSSLSSVFVSVSVFGLILISTAYPAWVAFKAATPGTAATWTPPASHGDDWNFVMPFNVANAVRPGLAAFLYEYFDGYREASVGSFFTDFAHFGKTVHHGKDCLAVCARLWLAPFDMGVKQDLRITFVPDEDDPRVSQIHFSLQRISGIPGDWHRLNLRFFKVLKKQFLIWRAAKPDQREKYILKGRSLENGSAEAEAPMAGSRGFFDDRGTES